MTEARRIRARWLFGCAVLAAAGASPAGGPDLRLVRASADGAGGGVAQGPTYVVTLAYGQHDAGPAAFGGPYALAGGVFAAVPVDRLFGDGFE